MLLALAEAEQYLHDFDGATRRLQALTQREPAKAQVWLLLATLHRVQGRYGPSDQACAVLAQLRVQPYAEACAAENAALRGQCYAARGRLQALIGRATQPSTRNWLLTSLTELEQHAGQTAASDTAWRQAMQAGFETYTAVGYADFLLDQQRPQEAWDLLRPATASEGVVLRRAIAAKRLGLPEAAALHREIVERHAQAELRPEDSGHQRERALVTLDLLDLPAKALVHARKNLTRRREPIDLWLLARCARAAGDAGAQRSALGHRPARPGRRPHARYRRQPRPDLGRNRAAWPRIDALALASLVVEGCRFAVTGHALEQRNDGAHAVLPLLGQVVAVVCRAGDCRHHHAGGL